MPSTSGSTAALQRLFRVFSQSRLTESDAIAQRALQRRTGPTLDALAEASQQRDQTARIDQPPPRRIAVSMALALLSQPHLSGTFPNEADVDTGLRPNDPPLVVSNDVLEQALGLSKWEIDDLREEVDRRAGGLLKQQTLLHWLWARFGLPGPAEEALFRVLFPGTRAERLAIARRGGQLYFAVEQEEPPAASSLFLATLPWESDGVRPACRSFDARYVDPTLMRAMSRGMGLDAHDISSLLERTTVLIPAENKIEFLRRDAWRSGGYAQLTGLCPRYDGASSLLRPLMATDLQFLEWIGREDDEVKIRNARAVFDAFVAQRIQFVLYEHFADALSDVLSSESADGRSTEALHRYRWSDVLNRIARPLIEWTDSASVRRDISMQLGASPEAVAKAMDHCGDLWSGRLKSWTEPAQDEQLYGVLAQLTRRIACFDGELRSLYHRRPDPRWNHQDVLLLFSAHYVRDVAFVRRLVSNDLEPEHPGAAVGHYFWPAWRRVLDALEDEASTTSSGFITFNP